MNTGNNDIFNGIRSINVIEISCTRGNGTPEDPCREVHHYYEIAKDGDLKFLFLEDPAYERKNQ